jgi:AraC family transcriptional regulator
MVTEINFFYIIGVTMSDQAFTVDYNKKNACKLIFPSAPVLVSEPAKNFQFHHYELPPHHAPAHAPIQHVIVTYSGSQSFALKRELGGITKDERVESGDVMVSPAHIEHSADWDIPVELNFLLFDPKQIAEAAYEFIDPDRVEVLPHRTSSDPLISQISNALLTKVDDQAYIDAAGLFLSEHILKHYCSRKHQLKEINHPLSPIELKRIIDYVETNIGKKTIISDLANLVGMSHCHFGRAFKNPLALPRSSI